MRSQRVLIVEDYDANRDVLTLQLNYLGQDVNAANNGREALDLLQQGGFDLVVTDCNMPVMDGYELTRCIRHHGVLRRNPRFFRHPNFSPATNASRSISSLLLWKV